MSIKADEYPEYFAPYVQLGLSEQSLYKEMESSFTEALSYLQSISEDKRDFTYAEGKWTVGQVLQHIIDVELIMAHRAFRISRQDKVNLPGFDQDDYAQAADVSRKSMASLLKELKTVQNVTLLHYRSFDESTLSIKGSVSDNTVSVRGLGYIIVGHLKHHINLFKENYFTNA